MILNDLKWNAQVEVICNKVAARLYFPVAEYALHVQCFLPLYRNISPIS